MARVFIAVGSNLDPERKVRAARKFEVLREIAASLGAHDMRPLPEYTEALRREVGA